MKISTFILFLTCSYLSFTQDELLLSVSSAEKLSELPLKCLNKEFPNKLGQVLNNENELLSPDELHPVFYGCFDWHSSVHGHWLLVRLLKQFPEMKNSDTIIQILNNQFTEAKITQEINFFKTKYNESFERTYGWAWLLKLQQELNTWDLKEAKNWSKILQPLSDFIVIKYKTYLPKLVYPIRTGEHINSAFGLSFAYDYAEQVKDTSFIKLIKKRAIEFYFQDRNYPIHLEPSGYDFLSPALEEAELMMKVLTPIEYKNWLKKFLPDLMKKKFNLEPGKVSDRTDGKLVHLDGLNFSRAWCLYSLSGSNKKLGHLSALGDKHIKHSIQSIVDGDYMGEHWLASFAVYALLKRSETNSTLVIE